MEKFCRDYLLAVAHAYARGHDLALSTIGRRIHGAANFFPDFERGAVTVTLRQFDKMLLLFAQGDKGQGIAPWPAGEKWPKGTVRLRKGSVKK